MHKKSIRKLAQLHGWWVSQTFLKRTSRFSEEERRAWINEQLKQTLIRAYDGTRYYKEAFQKTGFDPRTDFTGPEVLPQLPLLTKDIIREREKDLIDTRYALFSATAETSGTTGRPLKMRLNESYIALDYACMYQMWAQAGYRFRDPFLALRSYVPSSEKEPLWRHDQAQNTLFMSAYHFSPRNAADYLKAISDFQPKFIRSYPSSLMVLAEHLERTGQRLPSVRGLFTASETLTQHERAIIERVFGRILYDWYGMTEPTLVAYEGNEHDGLNIVWQYGHAEMLKEDLLPDSDFKLVATSLHNPVMPFIRYDTGDVVTRHRLEASETLYPQRFERVQGRKDDIIITPDGRRLPSVNFYSVFRSAPGVVRFQIVQYGTSDIVVNIETTASDFESSAGYREVRQELRSRFGSEMSVEFRINPRFESSREGKTPVVLRKLANKAVEERQEYVIASQTAWSRHRAGESILKLDWNEADVLPVPKVREKLSQLITDPNSIIWYPEAHSADLHGALAQHHQVKETQVLATHGSDMALTYLVQCFVNTSDKVLLVTPGYDNFRAVVEQRGGSCLMFEHLGDGEFPVSNLQKRIQHETPRLIYLTNPNNPIGYHLLREKIAVLCEAAASVSALLVVDEAYAEFAPGDAVSLISKFSNLVIVRTFSKACGLAGLRVGYLLADNSLITTLKRVANPKHLTTFAQVAAMTVLEDWAQVLSHVEEVKKQRQRLLDFFHQHDIRCHESAGNFVLFYPPQIEAVETKLLEHGIMVRDRSSQVPGSLRITVGGEESMNRVVKALTEIFAQHER